MLLFAILLLVSSCTTMKRNIAMKRSANFFEKVERNPVTRTPQEVGLAYSDVSFKSLDGVNLKGWYIPNEGSKKTVIFNHFMVGNKAGAVPHKDWGNVTVDFLPIYKHLNEAGYNVLTYDLRNHGESDVYENGKLGLTTVEYQDVVASVRYTKAQYPDNDFYLYSQCYGTVSTIRAMGENPDDFKDIKAFINVQPLVPAAFVEGISKKFNIWDEEKSLERFEAQLVKKTGIGFEDIKIPAEAVTMPTLTLQVRGDWRTTAESVKNIHDNIASTDKKMIWIEDEEERLEGYNYFARNPQEMIAWFDNH